MLLFGSIPFETDDVPQDKLAELRTHADLQNKSLQTLIEDTLRESDVVFFTPDGAVSKNFARDCSNFPQFAKSRTKH